MVTYDGVAFVAEFGNAVELRLHQLQYSSLKEDMARGMASFRNGLCTPEQHERYFTEVWIPKAHNFISRWGGERVPPDLRRGINSAEANLGFSVTSWPELL